MSRLAVSSAHLIENAVICSSQMFMGRTSERRREGEKHFWSVVRFYNFMWHLCEDRLEVGAVWSVVLFCSPKNNETTKYIWIH